MLFTSHYRYIIIGIRVLLALTLFSRRKICLCTKRDKLRLQFVSLQFNKKCFSKKKSETIMRDFIESLKQIQFFMWVILDHSGSHGLLKFPWVVVFFCYLIFTLHFYLIVKILLAKFDNKLQVQRKLKVYWYVVMQQYNNLLLESALFIDLNKISIVYGQLKNGSGRDVSPYPQRHTLLT